MGGDGPWADSVREGDSGKWREVVACRRAVSLSSLPGSFLCSRSWPGEAGGGEEGSGAARYRCSPGARHCSCKK